MVKGLRLIVFILMFFTSYVDKTTFAQGFDNKQDCTALENKISSFQGPINLGELEIKLGDGFMTRMFFSIYKVNRCKIRGYYILSEKQFEMIVKSNFKEVQEENFEIFMISRIIDGPDKEQYWDKNKEIVLWPPSFVGADIEQLQEYQYVKSVGYFERYGLEETKK